MTLGQREHGSLWGWRARGGARLARWGPGSRAGLLARVQTMEGALPMVLQTGTAGGAFEQGRDRVERCF